MTKSKIKILIASAIFVVVLNIALYTWNQSPKVLKVSYLENVQVDRVAFDKEGQIWVSGEGELRVYKDGNLIQTFTNADTPVFGEYLRELEIDDKGRVWITSQLSEYEAHLAVFDGTKWSTVGVFSNPLGEKPGIKSLAIDTQGRAWVGTVSGLFIIDGGSQENYTSDNSDLLGNIVTCISFDDKGRAWIGSWSKTTRAGLNIFDGENWRSFTAKDSPRFNLRIDAIAFDLQGQTWVEAGGVYVYNGENWTTYEDKSFEKYLQKQSFLFQRAGKKCPIVCIPAHAAG